MGTPSYMAPEQAGGKKSDIGPAADVYALGAILYEMLTGRPPFRADTPLDTVLMVLSEEPVAPARVNPKLPRDMETICLKCLEKEPHRRYVSALALAEDLERFQAGEPVLARPVSRWERALKWVRRHPALATVYSLLFLVAILGVIGSGIAWLWQLSETARHEAEIAGQQAEASRKDAVAARAGLENALQAEQDAKKKTVDALKKEQAALQREAQAKEQVEQLSYVHRINLVQLHWQAGGVVAARQLLEGCDMNRRHWEWHYLKRVTYPELLTFQGHTEQVTHVVFSPDGRRLASASVDKTVKVWDAASGKQLFKLQGHTGAVTHVVFSRDGRRLASASDDKTVKVWDAAGGKELFNLQGHTGGVIRVVFSPDGRRLASASVDQTVKVWDAAGGKQLLNLQGHTGDVQHVVFSPDGRRLASASLDQTVKVWDAAGGKELLNLQGHASAQYTVGVNQVVFSPDGRRLASASSDTTTVKVWDAAGGKELHNLQGTPALSITWFSARTAGGWRRPVRTRR